MKKSILPLIILCVFGCSNQKKSDSAVKSNLKENPDSIKIIESPDIKITNYLSSEIGKQPTEKRDFKKGSVVKWDKVSIGYGHNIKNALDKSFGAMPIKTVDLEQALDINANPIKGVFCQYWEYENTDFEIELDFTYPKTDRNNMLVKLHITKK